MVSSSADLRVRRLRIQSRLVFSRADIQQAAPSRAPLSPPAPKSVTSLAAEKAVDGIGGTDCGPIAATLVEVRDPGSMAAFVENPVDGIGRPAHGLLAAIAKTLVEVPDPGSLAAFGKTLPDLLAQRRSKIRDRDYRLVGALAEQGRLRTQLQDRQRRPPTLRNLSQVACA